MAAVTIQNQYMSLYPATELNIQALRFDIDSGGNLTSVWQITNTTTNRETFRWFFIGDIGKSSLPTFGAVDLGPGESAFVNYGSQLGPSTLTQFITLGAVSQSGQRMTGSGRVDFTYLPKPATNFQVNAPAHATSGMPFDVTVTALDANGQTAVGYVGTVTFSSSDVDPGVLAPTDYTFTAADNGVHTFPGGFTLVTVGDQTLTATDTADQTITGTATVTVDPGG